jgi:cobalt-precorrin-5B (C1)-methyltransferase
MSEPPAPSDPASSAPGPADPGGVAPTPAAAEPATLRRGWTTGTCAAGATRAALLALVTGEVPATVPVRLPSGDRPEFAIAASALGDGWARAGIVKDAGDDPDVTHGALVLATVRRNPAGRGLTFHAGPGVGTVTKPGLPLAVGEPAINPVPRRMIGWAVEEVTAPLGLAPDVAVEIAVEDGARLALKTLNPRLGILGGLSILGTTGIVVPFSCAAWIHSIHRGVDVARALGLPHVAGATGATSETAVARLHGLDESALIDMGDFVGGLLKYLAAHPVPRVSIALGFAKAVKLGQGLLDLHSKRGGVDLAGLARLATAAGAPADVAAAVAVANSALDAREIAARAGVALAPLVAEAGWRTAAPLVAGRGMALEIVVFDRDGGLLATTGLRPA